LNWIAWGSLRLKGQNDQRHPESRKSRAQGKLEQNVYVRKGGGGTPNDLGNKAKI